MRILLIFLMTLFIFSFFIQATTLGSATRFEHLSIEQGLSQSRVLSVAKDNQGFMWFGTQDGLNRYDGYQFKVFRNDPKNPNSLSNNHIAALLKDSSGQLWIGMENGGLNRYERTTQQFIRYRHDANDSNSLSQDDVKYIYEDSNQILWVGTRGGLNKFDSTSQTFTHFKHDPADPYSLDNSKIRMIFEDSAGTLWVGTDGGLNRFDAATGRFTKYVKQQSDIHGFGGELVNTIIEDTNGILWVGTWRGGLYQLNPKTTKFERFHLNPKDPIITFINEDHKNRLWLSTFGSGIYRVNAQRTQTVRFEHQPSDPASLSQNEIWRSYKDDNDILWIGTYESGINKYELREKPFSHYKHQPDVMSSLSHNITWSITKDNSDTLWVGTNNGLNKFNASNGTFEHYKHDPDDASSLSGNMVRTLHVDSDGLLWVGTFDGGLSKLDPDTNQFTRYTIKSQGNTPNSIRTKLEASKGIFFIGSYDAGLIRLNTHTMETTYYNYSPTDPNSISSDIVWSLYQDADNTLWVGTKKGLNLFNQQTQTFKRYNHDPLDPTSLSHDTVRSIYQDSKGTLWVGTLAGLNKFNPVTGIFTNYRKHKTFPSDVILGIQEDDQSNLWLSTTKGLTKFNPVTEIFKNYDVNDGLQSNEFNQGASYKSADGELFFGGANGFNQFNPAQIQDDQQKPSVVLTDFLLANQSVPVVSQNQPTDDSRFTLPKSIDQIKQLNLTYEQNLISFEFAALHFSNQKKNQYKYKLEGFDNNWVVADAKFRRATYTNLPGGKYTLRVKASNQDNYWNEVGTSLNIHIAPPPWRTWWAYTAYVLLLSLPIVAFGLWQRRKIRYELALNHQLKHVDKLKDEFLANTSHELRTPLNGIIGLTESLIDGIAGDLPDAAVKNLSMVVSSGKRLANLINDILDFTKLKNHNLSLQTNPIDLYSMVEIVLVLSQPLLHKKTIKLINKVPQNLTPAEADENRLQQILFNLVGNAIKFTNQGSITVSAVQNKGRMSVSVTDTGIGIAPEQQADIFDSFKQIESHLKRTQSGAGLGLAVSKQLVALHGGTLEVESALDEGSCFSFSLPIANSEAQPMKEANQTVTRLHILENTASSLEVPSPDEQTASGNGPYDKRFRILLVDDEPINRQVVLNHLSLRNYEVVEASGGHQALAAIDSNGPFDLILLDIMMPNISGYEVCKEIRLKSPAHDLPIIFLTAKNQIADLVQSFSIGGNDYLTKPVSKHELLARVKTHLQLLDINRHLEEKVFERTAELENKNQEIIATQHQLIQSEKMASLGTLTSGVAHEINNPNNFIYVSSSTLRHNLSNFQQFLFELAGEDADQEVLDSFSNKFGFLFEQLNTIDLGSKRIETIVKDLRTFSQLDESEEKTVTVTKLLQSTVNLVQAKYQEVTDFIAQFEAEPQLYCLPAQLNQVFMNLLINACEAITRRQLDSDDKRQGKIIIRCTIEEEISGSLVVIKIKDNGCGMTEQTKRQILDPFFTTKDVGQGTGLGLSISYGIIEKHQGSLTVDTTPGIGSTFEIKLPMNTQH